MDFNKTIGLFPDRFQLAFFSETGVSVTGADVRNLSARCAAWLQGHGYQTIGIHMGNCPEFIYLLAGALRTGVKVVLFNALSSFETDIPVFERETVEEILRDRPDDSAGFTRKDWGPDEAFLALYTSGTNGERKLIEKSIKNFFGQRGIRPMWRFVIRLLGIRIYNCTPWYHNTGIALLLLALGGAFFTQITAGRFNPETMRKNLNSTLPGLVVTTPTMLARSARCGKIQLPFFIVCTGEYLSAETLELLERNGGGQLLYCPYGTTETGPITNLIYVFNSVRFKGKAILSILRASGFKDIIFNKQTLQPRCVGVLLKGVEVGFSEKGEILIRTKTMTEGGDGRLHNTGDIGFLKDNLLFITARSSGIINRSGEKIDPSDIEKVLSGLAGVRSVAVFGIPSRTHGEDICAAIESDGGAPVIDRASLVDKLPNYLIPSHLLFFDRFPMTGSGKVDLTRLRATAIGRLS